MIKSGEMRQTAVAWMVMNYGFTTIERGKIGECKSCDPAEVQVRLLDLYIVPINEKYYSESVAIIPRRGILFIK